MQSILGPFYDPPYDSPIEDCFAYNLVKYISRFADFDKQVWVDTSLGKFRMDFVVNSGGSKIAFECDGKVYHDYVKDEKRDEAILESGAVDTIYRITGVDINYHLEDCLYFISQLNPEIFSSRGMLNLETLLSDDARREDTVTITKQSIMVEYQNPSYLMIVVRRTRLTPEEDSPNILVGGLSHI